MFTSLMKGSNEKRMKYLRVPNPVLNHQIRSAQLKGIRSVDVIYFMRMRVRLKG